MAIAIVTPVALKSATATIWNTNYTYREILLLLRRNAPYGTDDLSLFVEAYRSHRNTWELQSNWREAVAMDLSAFKRGNRLPQYIHDAVIGIMCAGK